MRTLGTSGSHISGVEKSTCLVPFVDEGVCYVGTFIGFLKIGYEYSAATERVLRRPLWRPILNSHPRSKVAVNDAIALSFVFYLLFRSRHLR